MTKNQKSLRPDKESGRSNNQHPIRNFQTAIKRFSNDQRRVGYLFILPSMTVLFVFFFIPMIVAIAFSVMNFNITFSRVGFAGLSHFSRLTRDTRYWNAMKNTLYYTTFNVSGLFVLSLCTALLIKSRIKINVAYRTAYFLPVICSMTVVSIVWMFLLDPDIGSISFYLRRIFGNHLRFIHDTNQAMPTVIAVSIWKGFGYQMVIFMAALQAIPEVYYEAAAIDGVSRWRQLFGITLPMIKPTIGFVLVTSLSGSFQVFDQVYVMTQGGPAQRTETAVYLIYDTGFIQLRLDYAAAMSITLFAIILVLSLISYSRNKQVDVD